MLTTLLYHWCEFRFLALGIPCPGIGGSGRRSINAIPRLLKTNQTGITVRFTVDGSGHLAVVSKEWT
jgi:hypothetical protein